MKLKNLISYAVSAALSLNMLASFSSAASSDVTEPDKLIALTFDDGPNTTTTNDVLDVLEKYGAVGSFFLIGNNINDESAVTVKRAYDMGCEINNHSKTHSNMSDMSDEELLAEIQYVDDYVFEITGEHTKFFRPPFIDTSQNMYDVIDLPFICGVGCNDYMDDVTTQERADAVLSAAKDGLIVLLHDSAGNYQTVDALEIIIPALIEDGYEFVTLTELFERQGETPKETLLYSEVTKYPCSDYTDYKNLFSGEITGDGSWSGWSENTVLDRNELAQLGDSYALEADCEGIYPPVVVLQKWSGGTSLWYTIKPTYYNGERACFLAEDIQNALSENGVEYTDLDRMYILPYSGTMTMTSLDILIKEAPAESVSGDVNADGEFTVADVVMMQQYLLRAQTLTDWSAGDLYEDGCIDSLDLCLMRNMLFKSQ
ncbi:MAG: polysaccharide deacetylase family protein [Ruminococcus sp.]|nr:polysaccharide deacetylase family protein [Ruminococcus sp.]